MYVCYKSLLPYLKPYTVKVILAIGLCIPIGALDSVIAMSLKPYTDTVLMNNAEKNIFFVPILIVLFAIVQGILNYFATYLNASVGEKITRDIKHDLYKKMLLQDSVFFDKQKSGDIINKFNIHADNASAGLLSKMKMLVSRIFSSISLVCVLIYNSPQLSLIAVIILGVAFLPLSKIRKKIRDITKSVTNGLAGLVTEYNESYSGNKTVAAYNLQNYQEKKFLTSLNQLTSKKIKLSQKTAWISPMMHVIVSVGIGLSIAYGSYKISLGHMTSGNFVSFLTALILLYNPVKSMGNNVKEFQLSMVAVEHVLKTLNIKPSIANKKNAIKLLGFKERIELEHVNFGYKKKQTILSDISLTINKGETVALVGGSGGGKTTIANIILRFYDIASGSVKIDGIDIREYTLDSLRKNISVVFQDNFLFNGTIKDNIMLGRKNATIQDVQKAAEMACLNEFLGSLPDGLDTYIGERGVLLSGGQKQRVAIARAFLKDAPIVILDEATSALDNKSEEVVQKALENLMQDKTVIVIAHRLSTIRNADKIAVIDKGKILEVGKHDELMNKESGQYRMLYEKQFKK